MGSCRRCSYCGIQIPGRKQKSCRISFLRESIPTGMTGSCYFLVMGYFPTYTGHAQLLILTMHRIHAADSIGAWLKCICDPLAYLGQVWLGSCKAIIYLLYYYWELAECWSKINYPNERLQRNLFGSFFQRHPCMHAFHCLPSHSLRNNWVPVITYIQWYTGRSPRRQGSRGCRGYEASSPLHQSWRTRHARIPRPTFREQIRYYGEVSCLAFGHQGAPGIRHAEVTTPLQIRESCCPACVSIEVLGLFIENWPRYVPWSIRHRQSEEYKNFMPWFRSIATKVRSILDLLLTSSHHLSSSLSTNIMRRSFDSRSHILVCHRENVIIQCHKIRFGLSHSIHWLFDLLKTHVKPGAIFEWRTMVIDLFQGNVSERLR